MEESKVDIAGHTSHEGHARFKKKKRESKITWKISLKGMPKQTPKKHVAMAVIDPE